MIKTDINSFMARLKISQNDLANALGWSKGMVSLFISRKSGIGFDKIPILIEMGILPEELFGIEVGKKFRQNILNSENSEKPNDNILEKIEKRLEKLEEKEKLREARGGLDTRSLVTTA